MHDTTPHLLVMKRERIQAHRAMPAILGVALAVIFCCKGSCAFLWLNLP